MKMISHSYILHQVRLCPLNPIIEAFGSPKQSIRTLQFSRSSKANAVFHFSSSKKSCTPIACQHEADSAPLNQQELDDSTYKIDRMQREFDSLFLRFLEEDISTRILGDEEAATEAEGVKEVTQKPENLNVEEESSDPIYAFFKSSESHQFDSRQEGPVRRRVFRGSPWQVRETRPSNAGLTYMHDSETNAPVADTHDEGFGTSDVEVDSEPSSSLVEEEDLLKSIINIAKNLPVNTMLTDFLDPYIGKIDHKDCNLLLQILGEEGLCLQSLHLLEWMGLQEPSLVTPRTYSIIFTLLGKARMAEKVLVLFKNMPEGREFHCVNAYNALISSMSSCGRYDDAWDIFQEMKRRNIGPDSVTCSTLITVMRKSGQNAKDAWEFFESMSRKGVRWSSEIFGSLIKSFCNEGLRKEALIIQSEMEKHGFGPNVIIYNTLIDAYGKANQLEEAEGLFLELKERHLQPTVSTYNTLIDAYSKKGRHAVVEELLEEMEHSGLKPDVWTFTSLISAYGRQKMSEKAANAFLRMKKEGIIPTSHSYTALIHAHSVSGWHEKAYSAFEKMTREGLKPSIETYTTLLDGYRRAGDTQKLMEIWKMMMKDCVEGTRVTFNILVDGFAKQGHFREARDVIFEFGKLGLKPQVMTYNMLINAYARGGRHMKCPAILKEMKDANLKPDSYTYSTLIYAFFRVRDFKRAFYYHKEMIRDNQVPDSESYKKMKALLEQKRITKSERDRKAALGQIRKQMGIPSRAKKPKQFWKRKKEIHK
eukprot:Gb_28383 [translate_table: standard]